ncbi:hypothetical protein IW15_22250 [Chryseobacterium soli]|uniref:Uncharacterized protein n=1 Tax=Chryseobacterium soli TaxID=445961 RepID=A0A085ZZB8_9FLAO|nr:hypothetical protein [Chryseobacterium soli]KFF09782.1 hypothetical protein IW15_22250 [Chryseobacterium soli]
MIFYIQQVWYRLKEASPCHVEPATSLFLCGDPSIPLLNFVRKFQNKFHLLFICTQDDNARLHFVMLTEEASLCHVEPAETSFIFYVEILQLRSG